MSFTIILTQYMYRVWVVFATRADSLRNPFHNYLKATQFPAGFQLCQVSCQLKGCTYREQLQVTRYLDPFLDQLRWLTSDCSWRLIIQREVAKGYLPCTVCNVFLNLLTPFSWILTSVILVNQAVGNIGVGCPFNNYRRQIWRTHLFLKS